MAEKTLQSSIPFRYRIGSGVGSPETDAKGKKVYPKYLILPYVDARDVMDHLDEVVGPNNRQKEYRDVNGKIYCGIGIRNKDSGEFIWKRDVGEKTTISADKGEASDAFKRASVCRGVGRFLYSMPPAILTKEECATNRYNLTNYVKTKYSNEIADRAKTYAQKIEQSKYVEPTDMGYKVEDDDSNKSMDELVQMDDRK